MRIGIISDTHGLLRPEVIESLDGCEAILHGGDNLLGHDDIWDNLMRIKSPIVAAELMDLSLGDDKWETWDYESLVD